MHIFNKEIVKIWFPFSYSETLQTLEQEDDCKTVMNLIVYFRSAFIASVQKYIMNNADIKGEEDNTPKFAD